MNITVSNTPIYKTVCKCCKRQCLLISQGMSLSVQCVRDSVDDNEKLVDAMLGDIHDLNDTFAQISSEANDLKEYVDDNQTHLV